ncbi:MAG: NFACT family protein, partial [Chloroflexota bacterium]|nr:NFACT family protein [Chloroflexota bacterium]
MYFDALTTAAISDELAAHVLGGFVQRVVLPNRESIALEVYAHHERHQLLITIDPAHPRALLVSARPTAQPGLVTPFGLLLRKHVLDGVVEAIDQPAGERIVSLSIAKRHEGNNVTVWLHAELMGKHSNLMLLDAGRETVLESAKRVTPEMSSVRPILPKKPYLPPPARSGLPPHRVGPVELQDLVSTAKPTAALSQALVTGVAGLSPLAAREVAFRAGGDAQARAGDWTDWPALTRELRRLASLWATRDWQPCVARSDAGVVAYAPYELRHLEAAATLEHLP